MSIYSSISISFSIIDLSANCFFHCRQATRIRFELISQQVSVLFHVALLRFNNFVDWLPVWPRFFTRVQNRFLDSIFEDSTKVFACKQFRGISGPLSVVKEVEGVRSQQLMGSNRLHAWHLVIQKGCFTNVQHILRILEKRPMPIPY